MRISDWSSDVCSSDLLTADRLRARGIELDASVAYGRLEVSASYAYADSRMRASGVAAALDGLRPAQTPRHQASTRSEEHTSELQSLMRISYAVFCLKKKKKALNTKRK